MPSQLHVCFVNLSFGENSAGGVMHHMVGLARALHARGCAISVICPAYGEPWRYQHDGFIDVIGIREADIDWKLAPAMVGFGWRTRQALLALHREKPIDVIHLHDRPPVLGASAAARELGVPVVYTAHSIVQVWMERKRLLPAALLRLLEWRVARTGMQVIAVSEWVRNGIIALGADPGRVTVIPNGVDTTQFVYRDPIERDGSEILFVGRFEPEKGFDVLLRALVLLPPELKVRLTAIGGGRLEEQYWRLASVNGVADRVHFAGRCFGADLTAAYQRAAVCVLPSRVEPFGMVMLEAMACGTPFLGTAVGGIRGVVTDGETGLLIPPDNERELAAALARLLRDRSLAVGLARRARRLVEENFGWERVGDQTRSVYEAAMSAQARPSLHRERVASR